MSENSQATPEQIAEARQLYADGSNNDVEVDDNAACSRAKHGVWVQAWVWLPADEKE